LCAGDGRLDVVESDYKRLLKLAGDPTAAALLTLAESIERLRLDVRYGPAANTDAMSHALCLGVRYALFGTDAPADSTVVSLNVSLDVTDDVHVLAEVYAYAGRDSEPFEVVVAPKQGDVGR
jgi:hypothetical protein